MTISGEIMSVKKTEYWLKLTMKGNFPSGIEIDRFKINEKLYDKIFKMLNAEEYIISGEGYIII